MTKTKKLIAALIGLGAVAWSYADEDLDARVARLESKLGDTKVASTGISSLYDVNFYGFIETNAFWNQKSSLNDDKVLPSSVSTADETSEFGFDIKNTRFGFEINGAEGLDGKISGRIEADFRKNAAKDDLSLRLRHAYAKWEKDSWSVWAGLTNHVAAAVGAPRTLNADAMKCFGHIAGERAIQIGAGKSWEIGEAVMNTKLAISQSRPDSATNISYKSGTPAVQGYVDFAKKFLTDKDTRVSLSGLWNQEKLTTGNKDRYSTWAVIGGLELPLINWLTVSGQAYFGQNLNAYGAIAAYHATDTKNVREFGGFGQISIYPIDKLTLNAGYGCSKPKYGQIVGAALVDGAALATTIHKNEKVFLNATYDFTESLSTGLEYAYLRTHYKGTTAATDSKNSMSRVEASVKFKF